MKFTEATLTLSETEKLWFSLLPVLSARVMPCVANTAVCRPRCMRETKWGQAVNMDLSNATAWFATTAMRLHRLWFPFGEVQQDLLLSCLTVGQAYCLLEVLK